VSKEKTTKPDTETTQEPEITQEPEAANPTGLDIGKLKAEIVAEMSKAAQAEANKIIEEAKKKAEEILNSSKPKEEVSEQEMSREKEAEINEWLNERVPVQLFKDEGKYRDDVFISVNDKTYRIQRGKTVYVPRFVAIQLENNHRQEMETVNLMDAMTKEAFEKLSKI